MTDHQQPVLLDLFCGGGAASWGYAAAGFKVVGVDIRPQPLYPFEFHQADALTFPLGKFDVIHASPPCQGYSSHVSSVGAWDRTRGMNEPRLIEPVRELLQATGLPYVIENVAGARAFMRDPITLCGTMFNLPIARHRLFESNIALRAPEHKQCRGVAKAYAEEHGWEYRDMSVTGKGRHAGTSKRWAEIMGIGFPMSQHNYREAIPPAYTTWLGQQVREKLDEAPVRRLSL